MRAPRRVLRLASLEQLDSPDQLNGMLRVIDPAVWIAHAALAAVLLAAVAWGLLGRITHTVPARGEVLPSVPPGVIALREGGVVGRVLVQAGDPLAEGQTVLELDPAPLAIEAADLAQQLEHLRYRHARLHQDAQALAVQQDAADRDEAQRLERAIADAPAGSPERERASAALQSLRRAARERQAALARESLVQSLAEQELEARAARVRQRADAARTLRAPAAGRVRLVRAQPGQILPPGAPVIEFWPGGGPADLVRLDVRSDAPIRAGQPALVRAATA